MKIVFTIEVNADLSGYSAQVDCDQNARGVDAVAAIRALVEQTSKLTNQSVAAILGFVEKQSVAFREGLVVIGRGDA